MLNLNGTACAFRSFFQTVVKKAKNKTVKKAATASEAIIEHIILYKITKKRGFIKKMLAFK